MDYASYQHWLYGKRGNDLLSLQRTTPKESSYSKDSKNCKLVMFSQLIDTQFLFVNPQSLRAVLLALKGAAFEHALHRDQN